MIIKDFGSHSRFTNRLLCIPMWIFSLWNELIQQNEICKNFTISKNKLFLFKLMISSLFLLEKESLIKLLISFSTRALPLHVPIFPSTTCFFYPDNKCYCVYILGWKTWSLLYSSLHLQQTTTQMLVEWININISSHTWLPVFHLSHETPFFYHLLPLEKVLNPPAPWLETTTALLS